MVGDLWALRKYTVPYYNIGFPIRVCAAAALPCRDGTFNVPSIRTPTPWSECPTSVDLLLDLDLEVLEADAIATLDVIE